MSADNSIIPEQITWHRKAAQGCAFASFLAIPNSPQTQIWRKATSDGSIDVELISEIKALMNEACKDADIYILSILIPIIKTEDELKLFISMLNKHYEGVAIDCEFDIQLNCTLVRIRIPLSNEPEHLAWALGFINIKASPLTRRAPCTEIVLPTKSKQFFKEKYNRFALNRPTEKSKPRNKDENSVHLADIHIEGLTENTEKDNHFWDNTEKLKKAKLEGNLDARAKGKVSFTLAGEFSL